MTQLRLTIIYSIASCTAFQRDPWKYLRCTPFLWIQIWM